jgi:hypothetical protein
MKISNTQRENLEKWRYNNHNVIDTSEIVCPSCHYLQNTEYVCTKLNVFQGHPALCCEFCLHTFEIY